MASPLCFWGVEMDVEAKQTGRVNVGFRTEPTATPSVPELSWSDEVGQSLSRASEHLTDLREDDGHWCAEIEGDTILESEYILTMHFLGRTEDPRIEKAAEYLRRCQLESGGWALYPGGSADVSSSAKAYFVLKLAGDDPEADHMRRAREEVLRLGGLDATNSFTKLYLAIFGQYEWSQAPAVPPELILFPNWFPFNIYEMSSWSRAIVVPLSIIWAHRPHCAVPESVAIPELRTPSGVKIETALSEEAPTWSLFFVGVDRLLKVLERLRLIPLRRRALRNAERWILERLPKSEGLAAIFPPIVNTIMAFDCLGYSQDDPAMAGQIAELEALELESERTLRVQPCKSPLWDTCLSINALAETALPSDDRVLVTASNWILEREVREPGDWRVKAPETPVGGWYFEYANEFYPDTDDTAQILTALSKVRMNEEDSRRRREVVDRAFAWLLGMQNKDGGWGSFDRGCDKVALTYIPFADHNAMIDPSTSDITGRVLEAMARWGLDREAPAARRAIGYLRDQQESDGSWFGRWGCNYIYGTYLALCGLAAAGEDMSADWAERSAGWLRAHQNLDGGWGELPDSYDDPARKGCGPSTASQTSWALLGLFATGDTRSDSVVRGVQYLMDAQSDVGGWSETEWTGTGFPGVFYLKYHYYPIYFPVLALATYAQSLDASSPLET